MSSLGDGCLWKRNGRCQYYYKASAFEKKTYCDSDTGCDRCQHRPKNDGNKEIQRQHENAVRNNSDAGLGWIIIIVVVGIFIVGKFFL
jgi:hypothetical protein